MPAVSWLSAAAFCLFRRGCFAVCFAACWLFRCLLLLAPWLSVAVAVVLSVCWLPSVAVACAAVVLRCLLARLSRRGCLLPRAAAVCCLLAAVVLLVAPWLSAVVCCWLRRGCRCLLAVALLLACCWLLACLLLLLLLLVAVGCRCRCRGWLSACCWFAVAVWVVRCC